MKATHSFSNQESLEQHIRDLLRADGEGDNFISEYLDCIMAYSSLEDYVGITDEAIRKDYREWMAE
jgi:uncharacterized protein with ParB-like and HNH nuclease domain